MKLTKNFSLNEFLESRFFNESEQARVLTDYEANKETLEPNLIKLVDNLQVLRDYLGQPISINIAYRPKWYELSRGRSGKSKHVLCQAADIVVKGYTPEQVVDAIEQLIEDGKMDEGGLGSYSSFTHYDVFFEGKKRRWQG